MSKSFVPDALSQALAEPSRRAILENLRFGEKSVTDLVQATNLKQPNVSNHLAKMRDQGIVRAQRLGRQVFYSIAMPIADVLLRLHETATDPFGQGEREETDRLSGYGTKNGAVSNEPALHEDAFPGPPRHSITAPLLEEWREAFFECALTGMEGRAVTLVNAMLARRVDMETIYVLIFQTVLNRIGDMYIRGETDEAHEHLASALTERMMTKVAQFYTPVARASRSAVLGCVEGNYHTLGLRMLSDGLKSIGWETMFLSANVPGESFQTLVQTSKPDLVVASCAMEEQFPALRMLVYGLANARMEDKDAHWLIAVGGHYINRNPASIADLPLDFHAIDFPDFLQKLKSRFEE